MNHLKKISKITLTVVTSLLISCSEDDSSNNLKASQEGFVQNYANIVAANYEDAYTTANAMKTKIDAFLASPSEAGLEEAKDAWLYARDYYGQTEAFREANGPIDNEDLLGTEGQINAWPLDENYIDYVFDANTHQNVNNGLIADLDFTLTEENILAKNEEGGEANISTGWHAIEFLLWGQDLNYNPNTHQSDNYSVSGQRPFTDYTTADYADRRKQYLQIVTNLLVKDLKDLQDVWVTGGSYRTGFESMDEKEALKNILNGIGFISNGEVAAERLDPAIDEGQENEHSCFSDNTNQDMWANVHGINNVILGTYKRENGSIVSGTSLIELTQEASVSTAEHLTTAAKNTIEKLDALLNLEKPFDQIISEESIGSNGPAGQLSSALKTQGTAIAEAATALGTSISIQ